MYNALSWLSTGRRRYSANGGGGHSNRRSESVAAALSDSSRSGLRWGTKSRLASRGCLVVAAEAAEQSEPIALKALAAHTGASHAVDGRPFLCASSGRLFRRKRAAQGTSRACEEEHKQDVTAGIRRPARRNRGARRATWEGI